MPAVDTVSLLGVWEDGVSLPLIQRALTLLAAACPEKSAGEWAHTSIGERDTRLLRLQEELFGNELEVTAVCPRCGTQLEADFTTRDVEVLVPGVTGEKGFTVEASGYRLDYRLPTSVDLSEATACAVADRRETLLRRCVQAVRVGDAAVDAGTLPAGVVHAVLEEMTRADPLADVQVEVACASCQHAWTVAFDIVAYLWSEIDEWAQRLLLEVHALASAYGWSERDIFGLSASRRRLYLDLVGS